MTANPYLPTPVEILEVRRQTNQVYTFRLAWTIPVQSGQFVAVSVPQHGEAPISVSDFGEGYLELTIRKVGCATSSIVARRPGETLFVRGPYGQGFPLEHYHGKRLIIAAGGTGVVPVKGVIQHFLAHPQRLAGLDVLLGFKSPDHILFREEIDAWSQQANVQLTVYHPQAGWTGWVGYLPSLIGHLPLTTTEDVEAIIVGSPSTTKHAVQALRVRGLLPQHIWVSYERRMSCGIGKCGHCKINNTYICLDGPVLNFAQAQWLID